MMKKFIVIPVLLILFSVGLKAQHTLIFTNQDILFQQGKEFFSEHNYAASSRSFEEYLKKAGSTQAGQIQESKYYLAANAFELRQDDALAQLQNLLDLYPSIPFRDETNAMIGTLSFEKKDYVKALTYFNQVKDERLGKRERINFMFNKGYACLESKNYKDALPVFKELKEMDSRYKLSATYYYAYTQYCLGNYAEALPDFLKLEDNPAYINFVPY